MENTTQATPPEVQATPQENDAPQAREKWNSNLGFVLSSIGGAIGLGAVWMFPFTVGMYGGAAFLCVYLLALLFISTPILITEFAIGRRTELNYVSALKKLFPGKRYHYVGYAGLMVMIIVLSFYIGISGWTIAYFFKSVTGSYNGMESAQVIESFGTFLNEPYTLVFWEFVMMVLTVGVLTKGIQNGIEKLCKVLIPALFVMIIILVVNALQLPNAHLGLEFYLLPKFSALTPEAILAAIGLAFFTLGIGVGNMVAYGSYMGKEQAITSSSIYIILGNLLIAFLMGLIIFPSVFSFGIEPEAGPPLVFIVLPTIFANMQFGMVFATIFFLALFFACLTTTIALLQAIIIYFTDELKWTRKKALAIVGTTIFVLGIFQVLSFGPIAHIKLFGMSIFDLSNYFVSNILLPGSGLVMVLLIGWFSDPNDLLAEINTGKGMKIKTAYIVTIKYVTPAALVLVYLQSLGIIKF